MAAEKEGQSVEFDKSVKSAIVSLWYVHFLCKCVYKFILTLEMPRDGEQIAHLETNSFQQKSMYQLRNTENVCDLDSDPMISLHKVD